MTAEEAEMVAQKFAEKLQQARSVSDSEHYDHHVWIKIRIEAEKAKLVFWEDLRRHVFKWGAISVISSGGYALYLGLRQLLKTA